MKHIFLLFFITSLSFGQDYPKDYFISPLDIPLDVSGAFGELRSNHFHTGLDLKTKGVEGLPVYAVADGYVSRIKISTWGYGKAIYVTHPNGYTSVYGHLQSANGKIEEMIHKRHYDEKAFEIELFLKPSELPVKQGEVIALSGNSGGSGGPHLHFEIRDTKTEMVINPLLFGFDALVIDKYRPKVNSVMVYPLNDTIAINNEYLTQTIPLSINDEGSYVTNKITSNGAIGFSLNVFDNMTNPYNKNGIYKVSTFVNGVPYFSYKFDTFSFDESKHINYFIDYFRFKNMGQRFQKMFIENEYPLSIVNQNKRDGILKVQPSASYTYKIIVEDFSKNTSIIEIPVVYKKAQSPLIISTSTDKKIKAKNDYIFEEEKWTINFGANTFYENFNMRLNSKEDTLFLHEDEIPVKNSFNISFDISDLDETLKKKSFIAYLDGKDVDYIKSYIKGDKINAKVKKLGNYRVVQDTIAPKIYGVNFSEGKTIDTYTIISAKISDDLSGIDSYKAYLNGNWILMEYDYKSKKLVHTLSDNIYVKGKNDFKVVVTDEMNNSTTFESYFYKNN
ncbi:M23 family metallopeptidase [Flavobacterium gelidilacus]|uniref:M23 family metallopeptidase n=1 Tax=Flavobacterium gelidilacus TaxID=206041 RepID=UPI0003FC7C29|nr:M23 family metallopeptidase [Flavobacterium gelidilacus]